MIRRNDIQVLRCVAICLVFLHHLIPESFINAYLGVDVFFIVSGYLIIPKLERIALERTSKKLKLKSVKQFYMKRFMRLAPALAVALVIVNVLYFLGGSLREIESLVPTSMCALAGFANICAFRNKPDYFDMTQSPLTHLWSLAVEEQIYLILPILLISGFARGRKKLAFLLCCLFAFAISLLNPSGFLFSYYSPLGRLFEFIIGGLAFSAHKVQLNIKFIRWFALISLLITIIPLEINRSISTSFVLVSTFLILSRQDFLNFRVGTSAIYYLGDRSYSIYLYHFPIIILTKQSPLIPNNFSKVVLGLLVICVTVSLANLSYEIVEKRLYFKLDFSKLAVIPSIKVYASAVLLFLMLGSFGIKSEWMFHRQNQINFPKPPNVVKMVNPNFELEEHETQIVLIGDSHANVLSGELNKALANFGYKVINVSRLGCEFILGSKLNNYKFESNERFKRCLEHNHAVLEFARNRNSRIILSQRSTVYQPEGLKMDSRDYRKVFLESLQEIVSLDNDILIIGPNPEFPILQSSFYKDVTLFQGIDPMPGSISISSMRNEAFSDNLILKGVAKNYKKSYINMIGHFCNRYTCLRSFENQWLFTDESHFSHAGTQFAILKIQGSLADFVKRQ